MNQPDWKWYGFAGHHICGTRCQFHLTTSIGERFLVSTVGQFVPDPLRAPETTQEVGADRHFETMVFEIDGDDDNGNPAIKDYECVGMEGYNDSLEAEKGHHILCERYSQVVKPS